MGSKEILLKKIQKAVLRSSVVILSLFVVTVAGQRRGAGAGIAAPAQTQPQRLAPRALPRQWGASNCCARTPDCVWASASPT